MILVIDNYDSFTYNLVQHLGELGADLKVVRNDQTTIAEIEKLAPERIVLSPGPCTPDDAGITLDVRLYKVKGNRNADLTWDGANSANVDVYRNGTKVATTPDDGLYTDPIGGKGGGTFTYKVCEAGTTTCSPNEAVSF